MTGNDSIQDRLVGDYRLHERISDDGHTATWTAEQVSVGRTVIVDELLDLSGEGRERFLADTRARAAVDHPFIASVYEAADEEGHCIRASERLAADTLQALIDANITLEPARLARVLRHIAEANLHNETNFRATLPLELRYVHVDAGDVTRVANLAVAGYRGEGESARDVAHLGRELIPLVQHGRPGATRMLTLLAWMRGEERPAPLQWREIIELCDRVDRQLSAPINEPSLSGIGKELKLNARAFLLLGGSTLAALVVIMIVAWIMRPPKPEPTSNIRLAPVLIPAGEYPTHDDGIAAHDAFLIDARETTIGEYREFLDTLEVLASDDRHRTFDHPDQPADKLHHEPDDWSALLEAARSRGMWNGKRVTLNSPVPGVDWWDAMAYANWRKGRLPSEEEWAAAIHHQCENPSAIPSGPWHAAVPSDCPDRTPAGILGVAGSLSEWTRSESINPANPLSRPQRVIVGGSHLISNANALSRQWTADPSLRQVDLGFRLVRDVKDQE